MSFLESLKEIAKEDSSDSEDDEYIPNEKEKQQYEEQMKQQQFLDDLDKKKGKKQKKKEIFDLQKEMQDLVQKEKKRFELENEKQRIKNESGIEVYLGIAKKIVEDMEKNSFKKVTFAGKEFTVDAQGNIQEKKEQNKKKDETQDAKNNQDNQQIVNENEQNEQNSQQMENEDINNEKINKPVTQFEIRNELQTRLKYLKQVIEKINSRTKNINSLSKSKLDWKNFAKKEKIEKQLEQNRKAGFIDKQNFIKKSKLIQKEITKKGIKQSMPPPQKNHDD